MHVERADFVGVPARDVLRLRELSEGDGPTLHRHGPPRGGAQ